MPAAEPGPAAAPPAPPPPATAEEPRLPPPLIPAAVPGMQEAGLHGPLPRVAADGRTARQLYARPFDQAEKRSRVGLVVGGLGLNRALTEETIRRLPGAVTLAFSPYANGLGLLLERARDKGMETLVSLPLEPTGYPLNNPGDRALLAGLTAGEQQDRLEWALSRFTGYVGAIGALGSMRGERFAAITDRLAGLQQALDGRGLLYVDPRPGAPSPRAAWGRGVDVVVDDPPGRADIDRKLAALEQAARERGQALGYAGEATPVLLERVAAWAGSLEGRGLVLAPVSALIRRPEQGNSGAPAPPRPIERRR